MSEQINFDQLNRKAGYHSAIKANTVTPLHEGVIVSEINFGERKTASGIILRSDDGTSHGVRPRWGKVYSVGPTQIDVAVGIIHESNDGVFGSKVAIRGEEFRAVCLCSVNVVQGGADESPDHRGICTALAGTVDWKFVTVGI